MVFVRLDKGIVRKLEVGRELPKEKVHLVITIEYEIAKKLFLEKRVRRLPSLADEQGWSTSTAFAGGRSSPPALSSLPTGF